MNTLVVFSLLVAAAVAEPQYFYPGYTGVVPQYYSAAGVVPVANNYYGAHAVVASPYVAAPAVTPYVATVTYPSQDTSRGLPQPVQDTAEVKAAKAVFAKQYENAAVTSALGTNVHNVQKRAAVLPVVPYKTPASTSPLVYSASPAYYTTYGSQYVTPYNYGVAPYATYY